MEESADTIILRVSKNVLSLTVSFAAQAISGFLVIVVIARLSGVENVGMWSTAIAFTWAFAALMDFGLNRLLIPEVAARRDEADNYVNNSITLCIVFGLVALLGMALIANWLGYPEGIIRAVYLAGLAQFLHVLARLIRSVFRALERMELETASIVFQEGVFLTLGIGVLHFNLPFLWVFGAYALSRLAGLWLSWLLYRRHLGRLSPRVDRRVCRELLVKAWPFAGTEALSMLYLKADVLILALFHGVAAVGYYEAATNLFFRLNIFARMFNQSLLPRLSQEYATRPDEMREYVDLAVKYQVTLALPMSVGGLVLSRQIIEFFYATGFELSILPFQLLISFVTLRFVDHTLGITLTAMGLQTRRLGALAVATATNLLLNAVLIPRYSYLGATISTIVAEVSLFVVLYIFLQQQVPNLIRPQTFVKPLLGAAAMSGVLLALEGIHLLLLVPLGAIVYALALLVLRSFSTEETRFMLRVLAALRIVPKPLQRWLGDALHARSEG